MLCRKEHACLEYQSIENRFIEKIYSTGANICVEESHE